MPRDPLSIILYVIMFIILVYVLLWAMSQFTHDDVNAMHNIVMAAVTPMDVGRK